MLFWNEGNRGEEDDVWDWLGILLVFFTTPCNGVVIFDCEVSGFVYGTVCWLPLIILSVVVVVGVVVVEVSGFGCENKGVFGVEVVLAVFPPDCGTWVVVPKPVNIVLFVGFC